MKVLKVKYVVWAADVSRALSFYQDAFDGEITLETPHWNEIEVSGATIGVHPGGSGKKTWTGMSFQVEDVREGVAAVLAAGGVLLKEPEEEDGFIHLAMCADSEQNEFMLTAKRPS